MTQPTASRTVGVLYCGDLGSSLSTLMRKAGLRVLTTCVGRSPNTQRRARDSGAEILPSADDVVEASDVVISLVHPDAALDVARDYAQRARGVRKGQVFVDANSVNLDVVAAIEKVLTDSDLDLVDATIHGGAARLEELGVMYLSGSRAPELRDLLQGILRTRILGGRAGQAKQLKLLLAGIAKSLNALFLEIAVMAENADVLDSFLEEYQRFYPGLKAAIDRMLPTYPEHASRRVVELQGVELLAQATSSPHEMTRAAGQVLKRCARIWEGQPSPTRVSGAQTVPEIIRTVAAAAKPTTPAIRGESHDDS